MTRRLTRRTFLPAIGVVGGAVFARAAALFPEREMLAGAVPAGLLTPEKKQIKVKQLIGGELKAAVARARRTGAGSGSLHSLAGRGFAAVPEGAGAIEVNGLDGTAYGSMVSSELVHSDGRHARFIQRVTPNGTLTGFTISDAADPNRIEVYESDGDEPRWVGVVTLRPDHSALIEWANGERTEVPPRPLTGADLDGGHGGVAAPLSDWVQVCNWVCTLSCGVVCGLMFLVVCAACTGGTLGACAVICAVTAILVCGISCTNYCDVACSWVWI